MSANDDALRALARALTPYLREELGLGPRETPSTDGAVWSPDYDAPTCRQFVHRNHIGDTVLLRMRTFFGELATSGCVSAPDLVQQLGLKGPTSIPANLTNPLKKRVARFGFTKPPWDEDATPDDRTLWLDRDGIAERMVPAIEEEIAERGLA